MEGKDYIYWIPVLNQFSFIIFLNIPLRGLVEDNYNI